MYTLKQARGAAGLTQSELAKELGVTVQTIVRWENGDTMIDAASFLKLADLAGLAANSIVVEKK